MMMCWRVYGPCKSWACWNLWRFLFHELNSRLFVWSRLFGDLYYVYCNSVPLLASKSLVWMWSAHDAADRLAYGVWFYTCFYDGFLWVTAFLTMGQMKVTFFEFQFRLFIYLIIYFCFFFCWFVCFLLTWK